MSAMAVMSALGRTARSVAVCGRGAGARAPAAAAGFCSAARPPVLPQQAWIDRAESLDSMPGRERFKPAAVRAMQGHSPRSLGEQTPDERQMCEKLRVMGQNRQHQQAMDFFRSIEEPSMHVRVATLRALTRSFQEDMAWQFFREFPEKIVPAYNLMLAMLSKNRRLREVEGLMAEFNEQGLQMNVYTYGALISAYGTAGDTSRVLSLLEEMDQKGLRLTEVEYGTALGACGRNGDTDAAKQVLAKMDRAGVTPHIGHMTSLILSYSRTRDMQGARAAFEKIRELGLKPDVVAYTALLGVISGHDALSQARAIQDEMIKEGIMPHVYFYSNLLQAAIESADDEGFQKILEEMDQRGIQRNYKIEARIFEFEREKSRREAQQQYQQFQQQDAQAAVPEVEAPLPEGWSSAADPNTGRSYYWKVDDPNNSVTWERPR